MTFNFNLSNTFKNMTQSGKKALAYEFNTPTTRGRILSKSEIVKNIIEYDNLSIADINILVFPSADNESIQYIITDKMQYQYQLFYIDIFDNTIKFHPTEKQREQILNNSNILCTAKEFNQYQKNYCKRHKIDNTQFNKGFTTELIIKHNNNQYFKFNNLPFSISPDITFKDGTKAQIKFYGGEL